jgi:methylated-DNA-protein-cysteine methyltransferase-like protein
MAEGEMTPEEAATVMAQVFALVRACPAGRATTFGALAKAIGHPRGARMVGWVMNEATKEVPAQRVVNSQGELSGSWAFAAPDAMRGRLEAEGVPFLEDGRVDLKRCGWEPLRDLGAADVADVLAHADGNEIVPSDRIMYRLRHDVASPFRR